MKNLSKIQKKFLKFIVKEKATSVSIMIKDKLFDFFSDNYPNYYLIITNQLIISIKSKAPSNTDQTNNVKGDLIDILVLLSYLVKNDYLFLYEQKNLSKIHSKEEFEKEVYNFQFSNDKSYYKILTSNYSISPGLREFVGHVIQFKTPEQKQNVLSFVLALVALLVSIGVGIVSIQVQNKSIKIQEDSIKAQYDIARHINTVVEFSKDTKLKIDDKTTK